ncbi:MAG TPA: hypothetical protein VFP58_13590 [Candidatus Eisenbacteria bacterium]|nr:hypothetical protein [Candidatus Eisenbacteria bacterium]
MDDQKIVTAAPESGAAEAPRVSQAQALLGVFTRPNATFDGMRAKPHFLLATAILIAAQVILAIVILQSGAVQNDAVEKMEAEGKPEAQIQAVVDYFDSPVAMPVTAITGGVAFAFILLLMSGLMFFMGNLMQGAKLTFSHYLSAAAHGYLVGLIDQGVRAALAYQKGTMNIPLGLGIVLPEDMGPLGRMLDTMTDPLLLWATAIIVIGVSVYARKGIRFGVITVLPGFLLGVALSAFR